MIRLAISADGHVTGPADLWSENLPPSLRDKGPRAEVRDGMIALVVENKLVRKMVDAPPDAVEGSSISLEGWGENDPAARLETLAADGVSGEVLYPTMAFFTAYSIEDGALQDAVCQVYNDWLIDTFADPRFAAVAILPSSQPEACTREIERLSPRGLRAALLPAHSDDLPYNRSEWEPFWETAAGLGVSLSFHAGTGRHQAPVRGPGGAVTNYVVTVSGPLETASILCAAGILERHPTLNVAMIECGAGWLAWALDAMDEAYREHEMFVKPKLEALPSEYFRRQGAVTFQCDPVGIRNRVATGNRCLLWGSDYPHPEGTYPKSREILEKQFEGVEQEAVDSITWRNAVDLYGLALPDDFASERAQAS